MVVNPLSMDGANSATIVLNDYQWKPWKVEPVAELSRYSYCRECCLSAGYHRWRLMKKMLSSIFLLIAKGCVVIVA